VAARARTSVRPPFRTRAIDLEQAALRGGVIGVSRFREPTLARPSGRDNSEEMRGKVLLAENSHRRNTVLKLDMVRGPRGGESARRWRLVGPPTTTASTKLGR
jgi:hypothetical protein